MPDVPFSSLADQKAISLAAKYQEKKQRIAPTPDYSHLDFGDSGETGLVDLGQASLLRAGGSLADAGKGISNALFGTDFDDSAETGYSDPAAADLAAGVSLAYRTNLQNEQRRVLEEVADEDYLGAIGAAGNVALRTAVDSFATIPEIAAGAAATALGGAGAPILAKKVKDVFTTGSKIKEAYSDVKRLKEANRLGKAIQKTKDLTKLTAKSAGQASILTADLTQQQVSEYREKYGEDPSPERLTAMTLGVLATTIWEPSIIAKLFIPNFKKEIVKEGQTLVQNLAKGQNLKNIGYRIGNAIKKVGAAGAAEAGQEYLQTWHEIFAVQITPEQADDLWKAVASKIDDKKLRDQALTGGILGGMAGGVTRGVISAPAVAAGTAADVTKATVKGTADVVGKGVSAAVKAGHKIADKADLKLLSDEEREILRNTYETRKTVVEEKSAAMDENIVRVKKAKTYEDIVADKDLEKTARAAQAELKLTDEDLKAPNALARIKDKIERGYGAQKTALEVELETSNVGRMGAQMAKNVGKATVKVTKAVIEKVPVEQVVETVQAYGEAAVTAVKEIRSSTALGIVEMGIKGGEGTTKKVIQAAKGLELADLQKAAALIKVKNPELGKKLEKMADVQREVLKGIGQRTDELINKDTLSPAIKEMAETGTLDVKEAANAATVIQQTLAGRIADKETLGQIKKAVEVYKQSDAYKTQPPGAINETSMGAIDDRLDKATSRLDRELTKENASAVKEKLKKAAKTVAEKTTKVAKKAVKAVDKFAEDTADKIDEAAREPKTLKEGSVRSKLNKLGTEIVKGPKIAAAIAENMSNIVDALKEEGYTTEKDLADLVKQFPFLAQDEAFYAKLQSQFGIEPKTEPETDVVMSKEDKINTAEDAVVSDNVIVSMYKKFTGCKS